MSKLAISLFRRIKRLGGGSASPDDTDNLLLETGDGLLLETGDLLLLETA